MDCFVGLLWNGVGELFWGNLQTIWAPIEPPIGFPLGDSGEVFRQGFPLRVSFEGFLSGILVR